ncbi:MAG: ABC transporter permease [Candidatus Eisenbacteria bacterium]
MRRILAMARKEVLHILRDKRSLGVAVLMPLAMVLIFGFAIDMELKDLPIGVLDQDRTTESRALVREMTSSGFIEVARTLNDRSEVEPGFRRSEFRAAIVIPSGFGEKLGERRESPVQVLIDGADGTTAATVDNYLTAVLLRYNAGLLRSADGGTATGGAEHAGFGRIDPRVRIDFNPELVSAYHVVPGLVAVILMMICALLTSIALAREKETGTLEQVLTTPVAPAQVIIGKLLPYTVIGAIDAALVLAVGALVFGVPMRGSWLALSGYSFIYILIALSLGLLISAISGTQRVAMMVALVATYLPSLLLSGFVFELGSMPTPLRVFGQVIPATHYIRVIHGILLEGEAWFPKELAAMLILLLLLSGAAVRRFSATLE